MDKFDGLDARRRNEKLSPDELVPVVAELAQGQPWDIDDKHCIEFAEIFDADKNGFIDRGEFFRFCGGPRRRVHVESGRERRSGAPGGDMDDFGEAVSRPAAHRRRLANATSIYLCVTQNTLAPLERVHIAAASGSYKEGWYVVRALVRRRAEVPTRLVLPVEQLPSWRPKLLRYMISQSIEVVRRVREHDARLQAFRRKLLPLRPIPRFCRWHVESGRVARRVRREVLAGERTGGPGLAAAMPTRQLAAT